MLTNPDERPAPTFRQCAHEWFRELRSLDRARSTLDRYEGTLNLHIFPHIADLPIDQLTSRRIKEVLDAALGGGLSPRTLGVVRTAISGPCRVAYENGDIDSNPIGRVRSRRSQHKEVIPPDRAVVRAILTIAAEEDHYLFPFLHLLVHTGIRRSEAMALRWESVDLEGNSIRITESAVKAKGDGVIVARPKSRNSVRTVAVADFVADALRRHKALQVAAGVNSELVFPRKAGGFLRPTTITSHLKRLGALAGFPEITFHKLRHYHASEALEVDPNGLSTSRRLGHSSIEVTMDIYGHIMNGRERVLADDVAQRIAGGRTSADHGSRVKSRGRARRKLRGPAVRTGRRGLA